MSRSLNKKNMVYNHRQTESRKMLKEEIKKNVAFLENCWPKYSKIKAYVAKGILIRYCQKTKFYLNPDFTRGQKESIYWFYINDKIDEFERIKVMIEIVSGHGCKYIKFTGELSDETDPVDGFEVNSNGVIKKLKIGRSTKRDLSSFDLEKNISESIDFTQSSAQISDCSEISFTPIDFSEINSYESIDFKQSSAQISDCSEISFDRLNDFLENNFYDSSSEDICINGYQWEDF